MSDGPLSPEEVAHRGFPTSFRGFDTGEVRAYLQRVANELKESTARERDLNRRLTDAEHRAAHPVIEGEALTRLLGEEMGRILASAQEAAGDLRARAEENAARILREAHDQAQHIRARAESVLAERTEEAEGEATEIRRIAAAEAASVVERARRQAADAAGEGEAKAREAVEEAQAVRARVLGDLARRKRLLQMQVETLRAGRERLVDAYRLVRRSMDEVADELERAETEARVAATAAGDRAAAGLEAEGDDGTSDAFPAALGAGGEAGAGAVADAEVEPGRAGDAGAPGRAGAAGRAGDAGEPDEPGRAGATGRAGDAGEPDEPGLAGATGEPGKSGGPGQVAPRRAGAAGEPGAPGPGRVVDAGPAARRGAAGPLGEPVGAAAGAAVGPDLHPAAAQRGSGGGPAGGDHDRSQPPLLRLVPQGDLEGGRRGAPSAAPEDRGVRPIVTRPGAAAPGPAAPGPTGLAVPRVPPSGEESPAGPPPVGEPAVPAAERGGMRPSLPPEPAAPGPATTPAAPGPAPAAPGREPATPGPATTPGPAGALVPPGAPSVERAAAPAPPAGAHPDPEPEVPAAEEGDMRRSLPPDREAPPTRQATAGASSAPPADGEAAPAPADGEAAPAPAVVVDELFARIRAGRADAVAKAQEVLREEQHEGQPADRAGPGSPAAAEEALLRRRDSAVDGLEARLARKLKRALQDEQNEVLDRLRSRRSPAGIDDLLPPPAEQADRYARAADELVRNSAAAGVAFAAPGGDARPRVDDVVRELATSIAEPLWRALERAVRSDAGAVDPSALVERIGAVYRECRVQRLEGLSGDAVTAGFSRGALAALGPGRAARWVVDDDGRPCPDCDDNALAGPTPPGDAFPTGQAHPPAHAGCRCLLAPAEVAAAVNGTG